MLEASPRVKSTIGKTFGGWLVLSYVGRRGYNYYVKCKCQCGIERSVRVGDLFHGVSKSCGCLGSLQKRFWEKVDKSEGCWLWIGMSVNNGYGLIIVNRKRHLAHRVSWGLHKGSIPKGLYVCHHCDVPACVNPDHLFVGTQSDNIKDMYAKGRRKPNTWYTKLMSNQVKEIRLRITNGESQKSIAKVFGVNPATISNIATRKTWKHV